MSEAAGEAFSACPSEEIGAYLDAELSAEGVAALDRHFAACRVCRDELNSQKAFLLELSQTLEADAAIELPKDFTRIVVTKAESGVSGLRKRSERTAAFAIVGLLVLLAAAGFAGDIGRVSTEAARPVGVLGTVADAAFGVIYNVGFALSFLVKKVLSGSAGALGSAAAAAVVFVLGCVAIRRLRRTARDAR